MHRIIYCSQATSDLSGDELIELLDLARTRNDAVGLTGMLLYSSQSFLQVLEGVRQALDATYARIKADSRHTNLRLLADVEVASPLFDGWSMGFEHVDDEDLAETSPASPPPSPTPSSTRTS